MAAPDGWAYRTSRMHALSYCFAVRSDDDTVGRRVEEMLAGLQAERCSEPPAHWYSLCRSVHPSAPPVRVPGAAQPRIRAPKVDVWRDTTLLAVSQCPGDALGHIVCDVNRAAAEASGEHLLFHAGALEDSGAGILVPGPSGSGKSTLVAGLVRAGLGYLTDELVALDLVSGFMLPYAKPITVKQGSFSVLQDMAPAVSCATAHEHPDPADRWESAEWQVPVGHDQGRVVGRPCAPALVVVPRYEADVETSLVGLSGTEAFLSLALNAVNLIGHGADGMAGLAALAAHCTCVALTMSDLDVACELVLSLLEGHGRSRRAGRTRHPMPAVAETRGRAR
jgi:hypothetical protein